MNDLHGERNVGVAGIAHVCRVCGADLTSVRLASSIDPGNLLPSNQGDLVMPTCRIVAVCSKGHEQAISWDANTPPAVDDVPLLTRLKFD